MESIKFFPIQKFIKPKLAHSSGCNGIVSPRIGSVADRIKKAGKGQGLAALVIRNGATPMPAKWYEFARPHRKSVV